MPAIKAPFAKRADGRIVHVSDVARGLACRCYCLHCDLRMIARQGQVMSHHFAHHGPDCGGGMTWLHRAAQEILAQDRRITLPSHRYGSEGGLTVLSDVRKEASIGKRRIDCLATTHQGVPLAVEMRVTHEVDDSKARDFRDQNVAAVEVDLRSLLGTLPDWDALRRAVCESPENIKWLHDPVAREKELKVIEEYRTHLRTLASHDQVGTYSSDYSVAAVECWKCGKDTPVFGWGEDEVQPDGDHESPNENRPPPEPRPRTISWTRSKTARTAYWGNHCLNCSSLQGGFFLFENTLEYVEGWFDEHGHGVGSWDVLDDVGTGYLSDL